MSSPYPYHWAKLRRKIIKRDKGRCCFCGETKNLHIHHLRPLSMGGNNEPYNLLTLCQACHIQEHNEIRQRGLSAIPGPEHEHLRDYLTNPKDVRRYAEYLRQRGIEPEFEVPHDKDI